MAHNNATGTLAVDDKEIKCYSGKTGRTDKASFSLSFKGFSFRGNSGACGVGRGTFDIKRIAQGKITPIRR